MSVFEGDLDQYVEIQPELTALFESAMAQARRAVDCPVSELQWYNNGAKNLESLAEEAELLVES